MARHRKTTQISAILLITTALSMSVCATSAQATKFTAKPLPRNGDPGGQTSHDRGEGKDFWNGQSTVVPNTRYKRRADYRDIEAQEKADKEREAQEAAEAKKEALEARKEAAKNQEQQLKKFKQEAVEFNNQAVAFGQRGMWHEAILAHEKAVKYDPGNKQFGINLSAARTAYGEKLLKGKQAAAAADMFRKALAAAPDNAMAGKMLADALEKTGIDPMDVDARLKIGDQLITQADLQGAYIEYQQALQIEPCAKVYTKMGDIELTFRRVTNAESWYHKAIAADASFGPPYRQLGFIQLSKKETTSAAASLRKAIILDSSDMAAGNALVDIWRKQVAADSKNPDNHLGLAAALQLTQDFVGAESEYKQLEMINPGHPALAPGRASLARAYQHARADKHKMAAETLFSQGLKREALVEVSQAVMMEPKNTAYQFLLGECLEAGGDYNGARQAYMVCVLGEPSREVGKKAAERIRELQDLAGSSKTGSMPALPQQTPPVMQQQFRNALPSMQNQQFVQRGMAMQPPKNMFEGTPGTEGMQAPQQMAMQNMMPGMQNMAMNNAPGNNMQNMAMNNNGMAMNGMQAMPAQNQMAMQAMQTRNFTMPNAGGTIAAGGTSGDNVGIGKAETSSNASPDIFSEVAVKERARDFMGAVSILREMPDLQNPEIHHRLAVNLLAAGQTSDAVSEFRIASCLKPADKAYAEDLARALSIHKRSLMSNNAGSAGSLEGGNK